MVGGGCGMMLGDGGWEEGGVRCWVMVGGGWGTMLGDGGWRVGYDVG